MNGCDTTQITDTLEKFHTIIVDKVDTTGVKVYFYISVLFTQAKDFNEVTDPPITFCSNVSTIFGIYNQLVSKIEDFERNGSRWIIQRLHNLDFSWYVVYFSVLLSYLFHFIYLYLYYIYIYYYILDMTIYNPIHASSYFPLPQLLKSKKALFSELHTFEIFKNY